MFKVDWWLLGAIFLLICLGLMVLFSVAPDQLYRQLGFVALGLLLFFLVSFTDYRLFSSAYLWLYGLSVSLLVLTAGFGYASRGATRWLALGIGQVQTAEIIKPLLILALAGWLTRVSAWKLKPTLGFIIGLSVPLMLVFRQPDLGSSLIILGTALGQIFAAGFPVVLMLIGSLSLGLATPWLWQLLRDYQRLRLLNFINPERDPLKTGYNAIQAMIAVGSGQLWGRGLGHGTQSHLKFLPERHTDFIFASLSEELGFAGALLVLILFLVLLVKILFIARSAPDRFGFLVCIGVFAYLFAQVFINLGMNLGLTPVTGITLPLLSSGGSSLLATFISLGLVASVAARARLPSPLQIRSIL
jgi:rod shape determining protein RodA